MQLQGNFVTSLTMGHLKISANIPGMSSLVPAITLAGLVVLYGSDITELLNVAVDQSLTFYQAQRILTIVLECYGFRAV